MTHRSAWRLRALCLLGALLLVGGCQTRSISNSGYAANGAPDNPSYLGELTEFDVLGIDLAAPATDEQIAQQLAGRKKIAVHKGEAIMVIQSGAGIPDAPMVSALEQHFSVVPFSGVPIQRQYQPSHVGPPMAKAVTANDRAANYASALRLAAAKSGAEIIYCYWGVLESAIEREPTKVVSWIPVIGSVIPDEAQHMRIRLKVAVVDVRTGTWSMFAPEAYDDAALSASLARGASDQRQVESLKEKAYKAAAATFVTKYVN